MDIQEIIRRRSGLSTFIVHLTRDWKHKTAKDRLKSILGSCTIVARSMFGHAKQYLEKRRMNIPSQRCVCFTETPLEYLYLLLAEIKNRDIQFQPYGIAFTKKDARAIGINPVWYVDITPGHDWISNHINALVEQAFQNGSGDNEDLEAIFPFIEQMGSGNKTGGGGYRKEFWWEREWRHVGDLNFFSRKTIGLCPEDEIPELQKFVKENEICDHRTKFIDPRWGLEEIIARLAGFQAENVDIL